MIEAFCEIKRRPDDNGPFGGLDDGRESDEWEDGGRDAVGVKTLTGGQRSTHHTTRIAVLCSNVSSEAGRNIRGNWSNKLS